VYRHFFLEYFSSHSFSLLKILTLLFFSFRCLSPPFPPLPSRTASWLKTLVFRPLFFDSEGSRAQVSFFLSAAFIVFPTTFLPLFCDSLFFLSEASHVLTSPLSLPNEMKILWSSPPTLNDPFSFPGNRFFYFRSSLGGAFTSFNQGSELFTFFPALLEYLSSSKALKCPPLKFSPCDKNLLRLNPPRVFIVFPSCGRIFPPPSQLSEELNFKFSKLSPPPSLLASKFSPPFLKCVCVTSPSSLFPLKDGGTPPPFCCLAKTTITP